MNKYYLAIDIGASSGRHILGHLQNGRIIQEEIHRFENGMKIKDGELCWDLEMLLKEIVLGMKKCKDVGKVPVSVGIDTWGVDFVLLDGEDRIIGNTVAYRDSRTNGMDEMVSFLVGEDELYERTGIQKQIFNSIYQLMAVKKKYPEYLERAKSFLMIPDYFHYLLTGVKKNEYTNATTTQLIGAATRQWDVELMGELGFPKDIFKEIVIPGTFIGDLTHEIQDKVGYNCKVVVPATHDTGSAVMAVPSNRSDTLYISSGTWSLMGIERSEADCSLRSKKHNFTNEGGYEYRFRYLKNIMGLWMIQSARKEFLTRYSFTEICAMASKESITSIVDCNNSRFLAPQSMIEEVKAYCTETGQDEPKSDSEVAALIYNSLTVCYRNTIEEIEELTGKHYRQINIVGGGTNAIYLNELTAKYTERKVLAGPTEATAIGNIMAQMIGEGELKNLEEARKCVYESFEIKEYL